MRIVAVSDMHGDLHTVFAALEIERPDLLLCCGDWGEAAELDGAQFKLVLREVTVFSVYGNHDDVPLLSEAVNRDGSSVLLHSGQIWEWHDLKFGGINGIWARSHAKPYYVTDEDVAAFAVRMAGREVDVLLTHGCPVGLADILPGNRHGGQRCFLDAFHAATPRLHLCGHLHYPQQRTLKDGRVAVNVGFTCEGDYWVIDIDAESLSVDQRKIG